MRTVLVSPPPRSHLSIDFFQAFTHAEHADLLEHRSLPLVGDQPCVRPLSHLFPRLHRQKPPGLATLRAPVPPIEARVFGRVQALDGVANPFLAVADLRFIMERIAPFSTVGSGGALCRQKT